MIEKILLATGLYKGLIAFLIGATSGIIRYLYDFQATDENKRKFDKKIFLIRAFISGCIGLIIFRTVGGIEFWIWFGGYMSGEILGFVENNGKKIITKIFNKFK